MIRISPIRVIGPENEQIGIIETQEALRMAQEAGLDLVEVVPDNRPPICKIMDYGKYKYDLSKKENKSNSSRTELKEIRLGRSIKIDPHDVQIRIEQARRFLLDGHKVQFIQRFRGREIAHKHLGLENLNHALEELSDICKIESEPKLVGRQATLMVSPDKAKVEAFKRKLEAERAAAEEENPEEETPVVEAPMSESEGDTEKKKKPSGDQRNSNPVDDEISALLGE